MAEKVRDKKAKSAGKNLNACPTAHEYNFIQRNPCRTVHN